MHPDSGFSIFHRGIVRAAIIILIRLSASALIVLSSMKTTADYTMHRLVSSILVSALTFCYSFVPNAFCFHRGKLNLFQPPNIRLLKCYRSDRTVYLLQARKRSSDDENTEEVLDDMFDPLELLPVEKKQEDEEELLEYAIDSFLRGDYDRQFSDDAPSPSPELSPGSAVEMALRALRDLDEPDMSHGAAVFQRFCLPLRRGERWGDSSRAGRDPWKEVLRGALTPSMLARRLRASEFSSLLDWTKLDVTEGAYSMERDLVGVPSIAFVNVALHFGEGIEPSLIQFTLKRMGGAWLIDTARRNQAELFVGRNQEKKKYP